MDKEQPDRLQIKLNPNEERIAADLKQKTGIDFRQYYNKELYQSLSDMIFLPYYLVVNTIAPILAGVIFSYAYIYVFISTHENIWGKTVFIAVAIAAFLICSFLYAVSGLIKALSKDFSNVATAGMDLVKRAVIDTSSLRERCKRGEKMPGLGEITKGVMLVAAVPMICFIIRERIFIIGEIISFIIEKIFYSTTSKIAENADKMAEENQSAIENTWSLSESDEASITKIRESADKYCLIIDKLKSQINSMLSAAGFGIGFPFRLMFFIFTPLFLLALWGLSILFN